MSRRRAILVASSLLSLSLVACGSDTTNPGPSPDGKIFDAPLPAIDAAVGPDAGVFSGTIALNDIKLVDIPTAGHGLQVNISFNASSTPASDVGSHGIPPCFSSVRDVTVPSMNPPNVDEGAVTFTINPGDAGVAGTIPNCTFQSSTSSYQCIGDQGTGGTIAASSVASVFTFTDSSSSKVFDAKLVGSYFIVVQGAGAGTVALPVVGASGNLLALQNSTAAAAPGAVGAYIVASGIGPVALQATPPAGTITGGPPELLANDDLVGVKLVGNAGQIAGFDITSAPLAVAPDFDLTNATKTLLATDLDLSGATNATFACDAANCGAPAGLSGILVVIDSTDATTVTAGTDFPAASKYAGTLQCAALGQQSVTIPAATLANLKSGMVNGSAVDFKPTKLRISIFREAFTPQSGGKVNVVAGHGYIKFQRLGAAQ